MSFCCKRIHKISIHNKVQIFLHSMVLETQCVEECGPNCKLGQLADLQVLGDAVLHIMRRVLFDRVILLNQKSAMNISK